MDIDVSQYTTGIYHSLSKQVLLHILHQEVVIVICIALDKKPVIISLFVIIQLP